MKKYPKEPDPPKEEMDTGVNQDLEIRILKSKRRRLKRDGCNGGGGLHGNLVVDAPPPEDETVETPNSRRSRSKGGEDGTGGGEVGNTAKTGKFEVTTTKTQIIKVDDGEESEEDEQEEETEDEKKKKPNKKVKTKEIVISIKKIPVGTIITKEQLDYGRIPISSFTNDMLTKKRQALKKRSTRNIHPKIILKKGMVK